MESTEVPFKINLCTTYCERASMIFQLNAWYGKDINGNQLPDDETEYVDGKCKRAGTLSVGVSVGATRAQVDCGALSLLFLPPSLPPSPSVLFFCQDAVLTDARI